MATRDFITAELVTKTDLQSAIRHFDAKLDDLSLRLTLPLGVTLVAAIVALAAVIKL